METSECLMRLACRVGGGPVLVLVLGFGKGDLGAQISKPREALGSFWVPPDRGIVDAGILVS